MQRMQNWEYETLLHKGEQRERLPVMGIPGDNNSMHPSSSSSLQVRLENWHLPAVNPQSSCSEPSDNLVLGYGNCGILEFHKCYFGEPLIDCRRLPCSCAASLVSSLGKLRQMNSRVILTQMYPYFCIFLQEKLNQIESCFCRLS